MHPVPPGPVVAKAAAAAAVAACLVIGGAASAADSASYNRYRDASKALRSGKDADLSAAETLFRQNLNDLEEVEAAVQADPSALENEGTELEARAAAHNREGLAQVYVRRRRYLKAAAEFEQACPMLELVYRDDPQIAKACRTDMRRALDLASARSDADDDVGAAPTRGGPQHADDTQSSEGHESLHRMADLLYRVSGATDRADAAQGAAQAASTASLPFVAIFATLVSAALAVALYTGALHSEGPLGVAWRAILRLRDRFAARRRPLPLETLRRLQKKKEEEKAKLQEQEKRKQRSAGSGASGAGVAPAASPASASPAAPGPASPSAARASSPTKGANGPSSGQLGSAKRVSKAEVKRQRRARKNARVRPTGDSQASAGDQSTAATQPATAPAPAQSASNSSSAPNQASDYGQAGPVEVGSGTGTGAGAGAGADMRPPAPGSSTAAGGVRQSRGEVQQEEEATGKAAGEKSSKGKKENREERGKAVAQQPVPRQRGVGAAAGTKKKAATAAGTGDKEGDEGEVGEQAEDLSVQTQRGKPVERSSSDGSPRARHAQRRVVDSLISPQRSAAQGSRWHAGKGAGGQGEEEEEEEEGDYEVSAAVGRDNTPLLSNAAGAQRERAGSLQEEFSVRHTPTRPDGPMGPGAMGMADPPNTLSDGPHRHRRSNSFGRRGVQQGAASRSVLGAAAAGQSGGRGGRAGRRTGSLDLTLPHPPRAADAAAGGGHPEWSDLDEVASVASDVSESSDGTLGSAAFAGGRRKRTLSIGSQSSEAEHGAESPSSRVMRLTPYHQMFEQPPPPSATAEVKRRYKRLVVTREQLEYYFSDANLEHDKYLCSNMDVLGFVPLSLIMDLPRIKEVAGDNVSLVMAAMDSSPDLVVALNTPNRNFRSSAQLKASCFVRRLEAWEQWVIPAFSDSGSPIPMEAASAAQLEELRQRQHEVVASGAHPVPLTSRPHPAGSGGEGSAEPAGEESKDEDEGEGGDEDEDEGEGEGEGEPAGEEGEGKGEPLSSTTSAASEVPSSEAEGAPQPEIPAPPTSAVAPTAEAMESPVSSTSASPTSSDSSSRASLRRQARTFVPHQAPAAPAPAPQPQPQPVPARAGTGGAAQRSGPRVRTYGAGTGSTPGMPVSPGAGGTAPFAFNNAMMLPVAGMLGVQPPRSIAGVAFLPAYGGGGGMVQSTGPFAMHHTPSPVLHAASVSPSTAPSQEATYAQAPTAAPASVASYGAAAPNADMKGGFSRVGAQPRRSSSAAQPRHTEGARNVAEAVPYSADTHAPPAAARAQRGGAPRAEAEVPAPATPPTQGPARRGGGPTSGSSSGAGSGGRNSGRGRTLAKRRLVPKGMNGHTSAAEAAKAQAAARRAVPSADTGRQSTPDAGSGLSAPAGRRGAAE